MRNQHTNSIQASKDEVAALKSDMNDLFKLCKKRESQVKALLEVVSLRCVDIVKTEEVFIKEVKGEFIKEADNAE